MIEQLQEIKKQALSDIAKADTEQMLSDVDHRIFGRKEGQITMILKNVKNLPALEKKNIGKAANEIKIELQVQISERLQEIKKESLQKAIAQEWIDVTAKDFNSCSFFSKGSLNPNTLIQNRLEDVFTSMGFSVVDGPDLESDYFNFEGLNFEDNHPARDMQDTFYIKDHPDWLMRTHTSNVQVRAMQQYGAPLSVVCPGRCYRNEATDARHEHTLYQFEGFIVNETINYANLKYLLEQVAKQLFGQQSQIRFNPKYYPFVEPGFSGDITCFLCEGKGCSVCKQTGWLEFFGAGMIHPNVLKAGNIDPEKYQGLAFGLGMSRMAMLKYNIDDARLICGGDLRFLKQF